MAIYVDDRGRRFHVQAGASSYVLEALHEGYLAHWYWGSRLRAGSWPDRRALMRSRAFAPNPFPNNEAFSFDTLPQEYPTWGRGDYRSAGYQVRLPNGTAVTDLLFRGYRVSPGKSATPGLPHIWVEDAHDADTLVITLADDLAGLVVELRYTALTHLNAIVRSASFYNRGPDPLVVEEALSASVDMADGAFEVLRLSGAWGRERRIERTALGYGKFSVESRRGASSHQANPFLALVEPGTDETRGQVYAMNLIYSGNFVANAEQDSFAVTRLQIGINPSQFRWPLESGEVFHTPEAVLVYGEHGLDDMSNTFHRLYRRHLMRDPWREGDRPIVLNNWEATYFAFDEAKLLELADSASALGVEVLVLDDGWFGNRNDDHRSLGDWQVNLKKLPHGIAGLSQAIHQRGLKFGLWVEPEMVSVDSDLYRQHPDWCLSVPDRSRSEGRHQLILDLSRDDVVEWMIGWLSDLLQTGGIDYIKWDMNRHMTEVGSALLPPEKQTQVGHRYMLGLYRVLETLTHAFPDVLFEGCSGGGGRFDPGMLFYMPQTWTSDDSDAIERLIIQHGTSLVYPPLSMTAHVSAVPNHQVGRKTPMMTRGLVAMAANFGYELDFTALNADDRQAISAQIRLYKALRPLVQTGRLHRLLDPHQGNAAAWMFVSQDRAQAFVVWVERLAEVNGPVRWLRLRGLDAERAYHVAKLGEDGVFQDVGIAGGDLLMAVGLSMLYVADFGAVAWQLTRMES